MKYLSQILRSNQIPLNIRISLYLRKEYTFLNFTNNLYLTLKPCL